MKKNAFTLVELMAIIVIMASMLLIILPAINNTIKNSEEKKKQDALNNIYMAAENYLMANYENYSNLDNVGAIEYVYIVDLISNNYLSIDTVNPNNDLAFTNQDTIKVTKKEDGTLGYELIYLKTLIETLMEQYQEGNQKGLVKDSSNPNLFYYTGTNEEVSNNFLWYGGHQWRVLNFDTEENTLTLITQQPLTAIQPANAVWTTSEDYYSSYINTWLNGYFWNSLDSKIQNNILNNIFNVGLYTDVDEITIKQSVGLLDYDQYLRAGNTDSFLDIKDAWLLGNYFDKSNFSRVNENGIHSSSTIAYVPGIRPVIKITNITIIGGDGSLTNSYETANKVTNLSDIQVGEYINVPYGGSDNACGSDNMCTFRVVSKNSEGIKVVLNGILPTTSIWADNASDNITTNDLIYKNVLNGFIKNIDTEYIKAGTYGVGMYGSGSSYNIPQSSTITAYVGLPTVGEMFCGNDIDLETSSAKIFVDINTIENPTVSNFYWTLNRSSSSYVRNMYKVGNLGVATTNYNNGMGVRPVIYLKNNLILLDGKGTAQNPYTLN